MSTKVCIAYRVEVDADCVLQIGRHDLEGHRCAEAAHDGVWDECGDEVQPQNHHCEIEESAKSSDC